MRTCNQPALYVCTCIRPLMHTNKYVSYCMHQIAHLSSEFYYLVPQKGYEYERLQPIQDTNTLGRYVEKVENLLELEVSGKILLAAQYRAKGKCLPGSVNVCFLASM